MSDDDENKYDRLYKTTVRFRKAFFIAFGTTVPPSLRDTLATNKKEKNRDKIEEKSDNITSSTKVYKSIAERAEAVVVMIVIIKTLRPGLSRCRIHRLAKIYLRHLSPILWIISYVLNTELYGDFTSSGGKDHPLVRCLTHLLRILSVPPKILHENAPFLTPRKQIRVDIVPDLRLTGKSRNYSVFHKFITHAKRDVQSNINDRMTALWLTSKEREPLTREINPDPRYAMRHALLELTIAKATLLSFEELLVLLNYVCQAFARDRVLGDSRNLPTLTSDLDALYLYNTLTTMTRARFKTKVIEVNLLQCTCHAKCSGLRHHVAAIAERYEQRFYDTFVFARASTVISPISRLSLTVKNNTVHAPVRCISSAAPSMSSCIVDGNTQLKHLPLYTLQIREDGTISYAHRFYISNSTTITDQLYRQCSSSATGQHTGLCFGGSRPGGVAPLVALKHIPILITTITTFSRLHYTEIHV
ncbi:hypothetical protein CAPTEDRAFT_187515 [Capitella teleta]|uniref:Uncharacterized protein n=1 Tax=Capitella teleta TaxID=283909 RepID=R7TUN5_CAPTE|nr:hypothetical protein CAPTEDRAFT_187515 [Capitella teleta]|eukprot:ELT95186.1 hypothetical protein CAPTEDRAFT_187515 [Capitella teleta]